MTENKTVKQPAASVGPDSALKSEKNVKAAAEKSAVPDAGNGVKDKRKVKRDGENRLLKAYLWLQSAKDKLDKTVDFLKKENAVLRRKLTELQAENARLAAPPDYGALTEDDAFVEFALKNERLKEKFIADYLKTLKGMGSVSVLSGSVGLSPLTPAAKPKSLAEAKKLAEILIKG